MTLFRYLYGSPYIAGQPKELPNLTESALSIKANSTSIGPEHTPEKNDPSLSKSSCQFCKSWKHRASDSLTLVLIRKTRSKSAIGFTIQMDAVVCKPNNVSVRNFQTVFKEPNYAIRFGKHKPEFVVAVDCGTHIRGALIIPAYFPRLRPQFRNERCERILVSMYQWSQNKRQIGV